MAHLRTLGLVIVALLSCGTGALAQETGDAARGRQYARTVCAECHAISAAEPVSPRPDVAPFKTIANTPGMTALALYVWFRSPHPTMPNLLLAPQDTDDVIAYILSLKDK
jgi:mono/diheme cytochrome c family protein